MPYSPSAALERCTFGDFAPSWTIFWRRVCLSTPTPSALWSLEPAITPTQNLRAALSGIVEKEAERLLGRIETDVALDRSKWKTKGAVAGVTQLLRQILPYRRYTLFTEHGPEGSGLIPGPQQLVLNVSIKTVVLHAVEAEAAEDYVELFNAQRGAAVDLSGWYLTAGDAGDDVKYVLPPGAVIPANRSCFIAADPAAFRRTRAGVQSGHLVLGPIRNLPLGTDYILVSLFDKDNYAGESQRPSRLKELRLRRLHVGWCTHCVYTRAATRSARRGSQQSVDNKHCGDAAGARG
jgi:hypothetical protein